MATIKAPGKQGGGTSIAFPDVCKTPAPPAPFVPIPYPNSQFQKNLKKANKVDAQAGAGNTKAIALQKEAIGNLKMSVGDEAGTLKGVVSHQRRSGMAIRCIKAELANRAAGK